jgi:DNA primase
MRTLSGGSVNDIQAVKAAYPLADVVERAGVRLRRVGPGTLQGLCPFHADRTPSFTIYVARQRFWCFGCGAGGDVLDFVQRHEGLRSVGEARAWLVGSPLPPPRRAGAGQVETVQPDRRWDRLKLEEQLVMNAAGTLYRDALWRSPEARAYLRQRGIPEWVSRRYGLGYSDGRSLEAHFRRHGGLRMAEHLGLLRRPEAGEDGRPLREFFARRIVVPELRGGQPIWFIGRHPSEREARVKYLALPGEKPILGLERAAGRREVFLVEGVFDWLTALSWGLPAFSTCGTGFPSNRLGWLARARVIFGVLDADRGGREGAERFGEILRKRWRPLALPDGLDLNDLGRRHDGRRLFFQLVAVERRKALEEARDRGRGGDAMVGEEAVDAQAAT